MKILIIGGTHFIGKEIADQAIRQGHEAVLFNRGKANPTPDLTLIKGDVDKILNYREQLLAVKPDIIIHCIAYTEQHARDLITVFKNEPLRMLILSSQDCYNAFQLLIRGKEGSDFPIDESMPTSEIKYYWSGILKHSGGDKYDKNLMTDVFMRAYREGIVQPTVFRLPMVYGPEDRQFMFRHGNIIRRIFDQRKDFVMSHSEQNQIFTYGYIENVAAAVLHALTCDQTIGKIYNIGETQVRTGRRWADLYSEVAKWPFHYHILPGELLSGDISTQNHPPKNLIFCCRLYPQEAGFVPPVALADAIRKTLEWGLAHPEALGEKPDYKKDDALIKDYYDFIGQYVKD